MAGDTVDPTLELVTLFGRLPDVKVPLPASVIAAKEMGAKRRCPSCRIHKGHEEFGRDIHQTDGVRATCKACNNAKMRARRTLLLKDPKYRRRLALYFRQKNYGIPPERFEAMLQEQGGCCAICRAKLVEGKETHVDHCHRTGRVRAILCRHCNLAVGHIEKSGVSAEAITAYIEHHRAAGLAT